MKISCCIDCYVVATLVDLKTVMLRVKIEPVLDGVIAEAAARSGESKSHIIRKWLLRGAVEAKKEQENGIFSAKKP